MSDAYDTTLCVEELREALDQQGITLPSLGVDILAAGLVALGNYNTATARELAAALRKAAER
ncbi:hypothetical protein AB0M61_24660 [Streptomyces sp. NPDC051642]|uniref:hypothetical protein n=1 Tax=Streptomyces sp. NPDC051642 TaxID=3154646 RepID=UPI0034388586